ncbi:MAG: VWA domain-containing protein, partial [Anaerolineales bacterium]
IVVICDISTSMRYCSELMLSLVYALQDQISKAHTFAFISHLEDLTPDFVGKAAGEAVRSVLDRMPSGYYNTDLGNSLDNFVGRYLDLIDSRTSFILVGDGRNNYNNPRLDLFQLLSRRAKNTIWLIPEPTHLWGTGDSDMLKYAVLCDAILQVKNLAELTAAIDHLFI